MAWRVRTPNRLWFDLRVGKTHIRAYAHFGWTIIAILLLQLYPVRHFLSSLLLRLGDLVAKNPW